MEGPYEFEPAGEQDSSVSCVAQLTLNHRRLTHTVSFAVSLAIITYLLVFGLWWLHLSVSNQPFTALARLRFGATDPRVTFRFADRVPDWQYHPYKHSTGHCFVRLLSLQRPIHCHASRLRVGTGCIFYTVNIQTLMVKHSSTVGGIRKCAAYCTPAAIHPSP